MKPTFRLDVEPEVEISMRRGRTYDEGATANALGKLYGGVMEAMQKAGTWQESMGLSVDLRRKTRYMLHKDVGREMTQMMGEVGSLAVRFDMAMLLKACAFEAAMD